MAKTKEEAWAEVKEEAARVKADGEARTSAKKEAVAKTKEEAWADVEEDAARVKADEETRTSAKKQARARAKEAAQVKPEQEARVKAEEEARAKAEQEAQAKAEEEARDKAEQEARAKADEEARVNAEEEARVKTEQEARAKAEEEARVKTEQEARAKAEEEASAKAEVEIVNFQDLGEAQLEPATMATSFHAMKFETIAAEATDYSKKTLKNGSAFVEKLLGAKSFESAILIQSEYAKASYADFVAYLTKIGELYSKLAKEAFTRRSHVG